MRCFYTNANSLTGKIVELKERIKDFDIIGIVETWANDEIRESELKIDAYEMHRVDRRGRKGGGVILYIRDSLRSAIQSSLMNIGFEDSVWCSVELKSCRLLVGLCYRSTSSKEQNNNKRIQLFEEAMKYERLTHTLIMGDFNYLNIDYKTQSVTAGSGTDSTKFFETIHFIQDLFLVQQVLEPTRIREGADSICSGLYIYK